MAEVTNDLIYEVLKQPQGQSSRLQEDIHGISEELSAIRGHMNAMQRDVHIIYDRLDSLERRSERIERRLELTDAHSGFGARERQSGGRA